MHYLPALGRRRLGAPCKLLRDVQILVSSGWGWAARFALIYGTLSVWRANANKCCAPLEILARSRVENQLNP